MKRFSLFFLIFTFAQSSLAKKILLKHPEASAAAFQEYLTENEEYSSWVDTIFLETLKQPDQERKIFDFGDSLTTDPTYFLGQIQDIEKNESLSLLSLQYLEDVSLKYLQSDTGKVHRSEFIKLYCKAQVLNDEGSAKYPCKLKLESLAPMAQKYSWIDRILIESKAIDPKNSVMLNEHTPYQWKLLSNSHRSVEFYGTYNDLIQTPFAASEFVQGQCDNFSIKERKINVKSATAVFFKPSCIKDISAENTQKSFLKEASPWHYAMAILTLSASIMYLKDKTLTITY